MKIKITAALPIDEKLRPKIGDIYEVKRTKLAPHSRKRVELYYIDVNGEEVGVYAHSECEVIERG